MEKGGIHTNQDIVTDLTTIRHGAVAKSDIVTNNSNVESAISDALLAHAAGDWANVSDIKVTIAEIIAAFSDALI